MNAALLWACAAAIFLPIDAVWLSVVGRRYYAPRMAGLLRPKPRLAVAALFYLLFLVGLVIFAMLPASSTQEAALLGAAFGFFCYATYDLTNLATIEGFPVDVALIDIAWGLSLSGAAAGGGFALAQFFSDR